MGFEAIVPFQAQLLLHAHVDELATAHQQLAQGARFLVTQSAHLRANRSDRDEQVFDILSYLDSAQLPLSTACQERLEQLRRDHPDWTGGSGKGMAHRVTEGHWIAGQVDNRSIDTLAPSEVPSHILSFKPPWKETLREVCEGIGVRIAHEPTWGLEALAAVAERTSELPSETFNPMLWGIRASVDDGSSKLGTESAEPLIDALARLVPQRQKSGRACLVCWKD